MNLYYLGMTLSTAAFYMTAGTGTAICMKSGNINLGGEGQIYAGGFVCAILLDYLSKFNCPGGFAIALGFLAAAIVSGILSSISALLQKYRNASFLLTSFIVSAAIIPLIDGLVTGPCRSKTSNLIATAFIPKNYRFKQLLSPSSFNGFFFVAILICVISGLFIYKTQFGKQICIYGKAPDFAKYSGFSSGKIEISSAIISGAMNGVTGAAAICGSYYSCHCGFYAGMGWNALAVAMIAGLNPFLIIPAGLFFAYVITWADQFALYHNFDFDISGMIQAIVIFAISIPFASKIKAKYSDLKNRSRK